MHPDDLTADEAQAEIARFAAQLRAELERQAVAAAEDRARLAEQCGGEARLAEMEALITRPELTEEEYAASVADLQPPPGTLVSFQWRENEIRIRHTTRGAIEASRRQEVGAFLAALRPAVRPRSPRSRSRTGCRSGRASRDGPDEPEPPLGGALADRTTVWA